MGNQSFIAIIGDIKDSRHLENRNKTQETFKGVLDHINNKYQANIASNFMITLGDSFQGLLHPEAYLFAILFELELAMSPVDFRFGIGVGQITTTINPTNSMEMDGPAYHLAREMIEQIEDSERKHHQPETNTLIRLQKDGSNVEIALNTILSLTTALKSKWTDRQKEVLYAYVNQAENQYHAAEALGIGQSSVNKVLKATSYYNYKNALQQATRLLRGTITC